MSNHDARVTLDQIAELARQAQKLCEGHPLESFMNDWKGMLALERVMELIGETVKRLPEDLRNRHPEVDWKAIAGMRDHLSHGKSVLMGNPIGILWNTVHKNVPADCRGGTNAPGARESHPAAKPLRSFA